MKMKKDKEYIEEKIKEFNRRINKLVLGLGYPETVYDIMR